jgi:hypothetical protein
MFQPSASNCTRNPTVQISTASTNADAATLHAIKRVLFKPYAVKNPAGQLQYTNSTHRVLTTAANAA